MKTKFKFFLAISIMALIPFYSIAQTPSDVLKHGTAVTFFGIDFSRSRGVVIGASAEEMRDKYFPAINTLLVTEQDKYSIKKALMKSEVKITLDDVNKINYKMETEHFSANTASEVKPFDQDIISQMIQSYDLKDMKGTGLVFLAEVLNKPENVGKYHLVYFSMPDGKVILAEKVQGKSKGFGMRNFWAHTIYDILESDLQKKLESKYLPKKKK